MADIDFSKYTIEELKSSLSGIDRDKYPDRVKTIEEFLAQRMADPEQVLEYESQSNFFGTHIPSNVAKSIWLNFTLWSIVFGLMFGLPMGLVFGFASAAFGLKSLLLLSIFQLLLGLLVSYMAIRKSIGQKYKRFEIVFLKNDDI